MRRTSAAAALKVLCVPPEEQYPITGEPDVASMSAHQNARKIRGVRYANHPKFE
jgi:hypothetical protein